MRLEARTHRADRHRLHPIADQYFPGVGCADQCDHTRHKPQPSAGAD
jgi:hypothetical protein